jgi:hypothetical protein
MFIILSASQNHVGLPETQLLSSRLRHPGWKSSSLLKMFLLQRGEDSGRHNWFRWMAGPEPEGRKTTVAINIFDLILLSMRNNEPGTEHYVWKEATPNSEFATRVLGTYTNHS